MPTSKACLMECSECAGIMSPKLDSYNYIECGVPGILLRNVQVLACDNTQCGNMKVTICAMASLHNEIYKAILRRREHTNEEQTFMRKYSAGRKDWHDYNPDMVYWNVVYFGSRHSDHWLILEPITE